VPAVTKGSNPIVIFFLFLAAALFIRHRVYRYAQWRGGITLPSHLILVAVQAVRIHILKEINAKIVTRPQDDEPVEMSLEGFGKVAAACRAL
jgi:hypothetical protein